MSPSSLACPILMVQTKITGQNQPGSWSKIAKKFVNCFSEDKRGRIKVSFSPKLKSDYQILIFFRAICCGPATVRQATEKMFHLSDQQP